ncbi:LysR substrate-binding domain-containing protein [soil metagenome]
MDLHQIEAFIAVAEELHFGNAARSLGVSQPPLSRTIRQLEAELHTDLFVRNTRNVQLTAAGEALLGPSRTMIEARSVAVQSVRRATQGTIGRVSIGFTAASNHEWVGALASAVRESHPGIELLFDSASFADRSIKSVEEGSLDLAMLRWEFPPNAVESRIIANEDFVIALPKDHELAHRENLSLADFENEPFVGLPAAPGMVTRIVLERFAHQLGFNPNFVQTAPDSWTLMTLVAAGVGCSFTVSSVSDSFASSRVVFRHLDDPIPQTQLRLVWKKSNLNPALRRVLEIAGRVMPSVGPVRVL